MEEAKKRLERYKVVKNKNENVHEKQGLTKEDLSKVQYWTMIRGENVDEEIIAGREANIFMPNYN